MYADYSVVGAGSSGCVLAARLCEAGDSVVAIEAGGRADPEAVKIPRLFPSLMDAEIDRGYRTCRPSGPNNGRILIFRQLFAVARNLPSFAFRGKASNAGEIGHKLGVRYLVEESVALAAMLPVVLSNLKRIIARE